MQHTLKNRTEFSNTFDKGIEIRTRSLILRVLYPASLLRSDPGFVPPPSKASPVLDQIDPTKKASFQSGFFKYGLIVSKKNGNAVVRNLVKRRIRSSIYGLRDKSNLYQLPLHMALIPRKMFQEMPLQEIMKDLSYAIRKACPDFHFK